MAAVDAVAHVDDVPIAKDVRDVIKGMSKLDVKADQSVSELTPQAKLMARVAAQVRTNSSKTDWQQHVVSNPHLHSADFALSCRRSARFRATGTFLLILCSRKAHPPASNLMTQTQRLS